MLIEFFLFKNNIKINVYTRYIYIHMSVYVCMLCLCVYKYKTHISILERLCLDFKTSN